MDCANTAKTYGITASPSSLCARLALLACHTREDVQKCVFESLRPNALRDRIDRSRRDLPIRSPRMRANTPKTHRSTAYPNPLCARLALLAYCSSEGVQKCVSESRRPSALRCRIDRSRRDLPIRSLRSYANTARFLFREAVSDPPRPGSALKDKRTLTVGGGKNTASLKSGARADPKSGLHFFFKRRDSSRALSRGHECVGAAMRNRRFDLLVRVLSSPELV